MIKLKKIFGGFIILTAMATGACMPLTSHRLNAPPIDPVPAEISAVSEEGSLWSVSTAANLFTDLKACKVNDILTISIVETSTASNNATTSLDRQSGLKAGWSGILEAFQQLGMIKELGNSHSVDFGNKFDGQGTTTNSSKLTAFITARVIKVRPNGNLVIRGARDVRVNNENQYIYIQGEVRPADISSNNVVLSTYLSPTRSSN